MAQSRFSYSLGVDRSESESYDGQTLTAGGTKDFDNAPVAAVIARVVGRALRTVLADCGPYDVNEIAAEFRAGLENK